MPRATPPHRARLRRGALAVTGAALLVIGAAGCGLFAHDDAATPSSTTTSSTTTSTTAPPVANSAPPTVSDPGAEPRQELRLHLTEGQESTITFTSDLAIDQDDGTRKQGIDSPPITQVLHYRVGDVTDDGASVSVRIARIEVQSKGTGLSDDAVDRLQQQLDPLEGTLGTGFVTTLGEWEDLTFDLPDDASDAVRSQVDALDAQIASIGPALPAEAVGVGARWTAKSTTSTGGNDDAVRTDTTATYTVTSLDDGVLAYTATITTTAQPHPLELSGLPKGTTAVLQSSELTGSTTGTLALDRPAYTLRTRTSGPQVIVLTSGGTDSTITQRVELAFRAETEAKGG